MQIETLGESWRIVNRPVHRPASQIPQEFLRFRCLNDPVLLAQPVEKWYCVAMIQEILLKRNVSVYRAKAGGRLDSIAIGIERASEKHLIEIGIASIDYIN